VDATQDLRDSGLGGGGCETQKRHSQSSARNPSHGDEVQVYNMRGFIGEFSVAWSHRSEFSGHIFPCAGI
jgi:hypothetical protein